MSAVVLSKWEERHGGGNYLLTRLGVFSGDPNFRSHMAWHVTHLIGTPINPNFFTVHCADIVVDGNFDIPRNVKATKTCVRPYQAYSMLDIIPQPVHEIAQIQSLCFSWNQRGY